MEQSLWTQLWPVVVGGLLAIAGGIIGTVVPEWFRRNQERKSLGKGIAAEVKAILVLVERRRFLQGMREILAKAEADPDPLMAHWFSFSARHDYFAVYHANLERIGLLDPAVSSLIVQFYTGAASLLEDIADMREGLRADLGRDETARRLRETIDLLEEVLRIGTQIVHGAA